MAQLFFLLLKIVSSCRFFNFLLMLAYYINEQCVTKWTAKLLFANITRTYPATVYHWTYMPVPKKMTKKSWYEFFKYICSFSSHNNQKIKNVVETQHWSVKIKFIVCGRIIRISKTCDKLYKLGFFCPPENGFCTKYTPY